jgi:hypothetical protein
VRTQDEYDKKDLTSHQKLTAYLLQKDDGPMKFQLQANWMRITHVVWIICNPLSASSQIRHLNVRFWRV